MSRGNTFSIGRVLLAVAALAVAAGPGWAGDKIEISDGTVARPATGATNRTGQAEQMSDSALRFEQRINEMHSRFGWRNSAPALPAGGAPMIQQAPVRRAPVARDGETGEDENWLSAPPRELDYEGALGVTLFRRDSGGAGAPTAAGASQNTDTVNRNADLFGSGQNPFEVGGDGDYFQPSGISSQGGANFGGLGVSGSRQGASSVFPSGLPGNANGMASGLNNPLNTALGLPTLDGNFQASGSGLSVNQILNPTAPGVQTTPNRFETGVNDALRRYSPAVAATPSPFAPASSLNLDDLLGRTRSLEISRQPSTDVEPRIFNRTETVKPAVLPGVRPQPLGF